MADDTAPAASTGPSATQIANARRVLAEAAKAGPSVDEVKTAMLDLVSDKSVLAAYDKMVATQRIAPADTELNYAISMLARLIQNYSPA